MIRFESISYKNILSVGQAPLTLDLSTYRLTALHGPSGSGKSLFLDALSFALFGRAFREINKTDLINSINGKGLSVEVHFSIGADKYKVVRGLKPNVFEISMNGQILNQDAHAKDQQKYLEDQILKMTWRMFTHVVMLGAANYTPFMRLKPNERKKMVENILGIDVFSTMNSVIKTKISDETTAYKAYVDRRDGLTSQVLYLEEQQRSFELRQKEELDALMGKLLVLRDKKKAIDLQVVEREQEIEVMISSFDPKVEIPAFAETFEETFTEEFTETFSEEFTEVYEEPDLAAFDVTELLSQRATLVAQITALQDKLKHIEKHSKFYAEHDTCPTCSQQIDQSFRDTSMAGLLREKADIDLAMSDAKKSGKDVQAQIVERETRKKEADANRAAFEKRQSDFRKRKADFETRRSAFETRRRGYEDRLRGFESRRRAHEEKLKTATLLIEEKKQKFEKQVALKRDGLQALQAQSSALVAEAKFLKEALEEKKAKPLLDNRDKIGALKSEIDGLNQDIDQSANRLKLLREAQVIIKDDGVKAEILKRYVPTLNKHINQYLTKMGLFVLFELDQEFNDTIRSRHRDLLSYANYSEGERQRIDLAVLWAWRHLAQLQSAVNTNLLVLDEVMDSYLDPATTELILNILKGDEFKAFNIVIISHKEGLSESFDRTIEFQKRNNFTAIA